jgi:hypothetical protein
MHGSMRSETSPPVIIWASQKLNAGAISIVYLEDIATEVSQQQQYERKGLAKIETAYVIYTSS